MSRTALLALFLMCPAHLFAQGLPSSSASVVRVTCRVGAQESVGTGFVWSRPNLIVTALHVVAGCTSLEVFSETLKAAAKAEVDRVLREGDLALIRVTGTFADAAGRELVPLKSGTAPNVKEEHLIVGYPRGVKTRQGDDIRFSLVDAQQPTLSDLFKSEAEFTRLVGNQGYPLYVSKIWRVSSTIQPGHSGAPILDKTGNVIGIGDGGLYGGASRINWAIPADYLQRLLTSNEQKPTQAPLHNAERAMFSADANTKDDLVDDAAGGEKLTRSWSATLGDMAGSADDEEAKDLEELFQTAKKDFDIDLRTAIIDIYEDDDTGASLAVPRGVALHLDAKTKLLEATAPSGRVAMYVQASADEGDRTMAAFAEVLDSVAAWQPDPDSEDEREEDGDYRHLEMSRVAKDGRGMETGQMFAGFTIDENSFLGTAVIATEYDKLTKEDLRALYLMMICVELSDYAKN